jgi:lipoprotein-anchoring transpeptidase ErfK/SrfK
MSSAGAGGPAREGGPAVSRRSALPLLALAGGLLVVLAVFVYLYDHSRRDLIAHGVRIDGIAVGGMHEAAARSKIEGVLRIRFDQPVTVGSGGRTWLLQPAAARVRVDAGSMVAQAVDVSREGSILTRTARGLFGGSVNRNIALAVSYDHQAVRELAARVRQAVDRPAVNASVQPTASGLNEVRGQVGLAVDYAALGARIDRSLVGQSASRRVTIPVHELQPAVSVARLAAEYPAYIVVDRSDFRLRFYEHLRLAKTYEIAVGMEGLETPAGLHKIEWKQEDPPWYVPDKAWAGALAGTVVPPGPADPLKARFMSFDGGAGIHGIDPSEYSTIGHDASHGCVRMRIPDVIDLYGHTPVGTPVYII